jgi:hypothetical protein
MAYILQNNIFQVSGIITAAQMNDLGNNPIVFETPANFYPSGFVLTPTSGTTQPFFTDDLGIICVSNNRILFLGNDPPNVTLSTFFGFANNVNPPNSFVQAFNIELAANNFWLTSADALNPTPGDYEYTYKFFGFVL